MSDPTSSRSPGSDRYWRSNLRLLVVLLAIWFAVSFGLGIFWVEPLNQIHVAGFPLGFWFAQQGSIVVFVGLIWFYAVRMDRLERVAVDEPTPDSERD